MQTIEEARRGAYWYGLVSAYMGEEPTLEDYKYALEKASSEMHKYDTTCALAEELKNLQKEVA